MGLYQKLKNVVKVSLAGLAISIATGCTYSHTAVPTVGVNIPLTDPLIKLNKGPIELTEEHIDINGDGAKDFIAISLNYTDFFNNPFYSVKVTLSEKKDGSFSYKKSEIAVHLGKIHLDKGLKYLVVEDMNSDGILDLIVIKQVDYFGSERGSVQNDLEKVLLLGKGDGTFKEPTRIDYYEKFR